MGDVTAVALSIGEPYAERALASVHRQTFGPMAVVRIIDVRPFYRAMNEAAARVGTDFFLQLDADMVPNDWCVEELRAAMDEGVGMAVGPLWDPLMGVEAGIKVFRTESVRRVRFRDTASPDVDFYQRLPEHGWRPAFVLPPPEAKRQTPWPTFGRHQPDYTPTYTYARYRLLGVRYRTRPDFGSLQWRYGRLLGSAHPLAVLARVALVAGVFGDQADGSNGASDDRIVTEALWMHGFSNETPDHRRELGEPIFPSTTPVETFARSHDIGVRCRSTMDHGTFRHRLDVVDHFDPPAVWYARLGLCHGLIVGACRPERVREACDLMEDLMRAG